MKRCYRISLLASALAAALPLHATDTTGEDAPPRSPVELSTVRVHASQEQAAPLQSGSFGPGDWRETPASVSVLDRDLLDRRHVRSLSELAGSDASLGDSYAPVGYYQNLAIRGFALDTGTGYRFNGLSMAGEQRQALEHVQRVEVLKGEAGISAGVVAPGGLVNYVAKRPAEVRSLLLGTDGEGTRHVAVDYGHWLTPGFGLRLNAAWENMGSYVAHGDGRRNLYALAADWLLGDRGKLEVDANYHGSEQRSASGYQLLGGTALPRGIDRKQMLGWQAWQRPVGIDSSNVTVLHTYEVSPSWQSRLSASHSRSVIDDYVSFAYGCYYADPCQDGSVPGNYFAPNGDYDIYDYRNPDDTRVNRQARAELQGHWQTGTVRHELALGADWLARSIDRHASVNAYVGSANIHDPRIPQYAPAQAEVGPKVRRLDSEQAALFVMDRIRIGDQWQWLLGGRYVRLDELARDKRGNPERDSRVSRFLPQVALVSKATPATHLYASYAQGIALGQEAPFWTSNEGSFLDPVLSHQLEVGAKYAPSQDFSLGAALFRIRQPFQHARADDSDYGYTFVEQGRQVHTGLELTANGRLGEHLRLDASASLLHARAVDTGSPAYEGHQLVNVPRLRAALFAEYELPFAAGWALTAGWRHASANVATTDGRVRAPAYHVVDAGLRWRQRLGERQLHWSLFVDNLFDKFYWRDTGGSAGDYYLFPGAPRQVRLSVSVAL